MQILAASTTAQRKNVLLAYDPHTYWKTARTNDILRKTLYVN